MDTISPRRRTCLSPNRLLGAVDRRFVLPTLSGPPTHGAECRQALTGQYDYPSDASVDGRARKPGLLLARERA